MKNSILFLLVFEAQTHNVYGKLTFLTPEEKAANGVIIG